MLIEFSVWLFKGKNQTMMRMDGHPKFSSNVFLRQEIQGKLNSSLLILLLKWDYKHIWF